MSSTLDLLLLLYSFEDLAYAAVTERFDRWVPALLGAWAMLNSAFVLLLAALEFSESRLIFEPAGYGPNRIAAAGLFHPYERFTGWFLLGIALGLGILAWGLFNARRAAIRVIAAPWASRS